MPIIKVWCLPPKQTEQNLNRLHQAIVAAIISIPELGLKDETEMTCLFPSDSMSYGLGEEIIVEISGLFEKPERTESVRQLLAEKVGKAVYALYPKTNKVECLVYSFNPKQGFWTSS
jgi:hypothetical protein